MPDDAPRPAPPDALDDDPLVTAVMTPRLVGISPDAPVATALGLMASTGVRHLPVLQGRRCLGLVVEADLVRHLAECGALVGGVRHPVAELCRPVEVLPAAARRSEAARAMRRGAGDAVLVADGEALVGIVTATDVVRSVAGAAVGVAP